MDTGEYIFWLVGFIFLVHFIVLVFDIYMNYRRRNGYPKVVVVDEKNQFFMDLVQDKVIGTTVKS
jgi:hypothetical protein